MAAGATYVSLASQTLTGAASSITFSSISGVYTDLIIVTNGAGVTSAAVIQVELNADTTASNYSNVYLYGDGSSAAANVQTSDKMVGRNYIAQQNNIIQFMNYSNSTSYKTILSRSNSAGNAVNALFAIWRNNAAITSIKLLVGAGNFDTGTTFSLYGIAAA